MTSPPESRRPSAGAVVADRAVDPLGAAATAATAAAAGVAAAVDEGDNSDAVAGSVVRYCSSRGGVFVIIAAAGLPPLALTTELCRRIGRTEGRAPAEGDDGSPCSSPGSPPRSPWPPWLALPASSSPPIDDTVAAAAASVVVVVVGVRFSKWGELADIATAICPAVAAAAAADTAAWSGISTDGGRTNAIEDDDSDEAERA